MDFSIIIPSRNRPRLLERALDSIFQQDFDSYEIIVVNDGSDGEEYQSLEYRFNEKKENLRFIHLDRSCAPHGKPHALNIGITYAQGEYIGFLDDDDYWLFPDHLSSVKKCIDITAGNFDVFLSNQEQSGIDGIIDKTNWLAPLTPYLERKVTPLMPDIYRVTPHLLMRHDDFCHMNTTIIKRQLLHDIDGFDVSLAYLEDYDFYLRLVDEAKHILFCTRYTSHHTIPDKTKNKTLSTIISFLEKKLLQVAVSNKRLLFAKRQEVRGHLVRTKKYSLKEICLQLKQDKDFSRSFHYAREVLLIGFSLKWFFLCLYLGMVICCKNVARK
jgi:glycosyltransferase involved in cell wall biosynthesis